MGSMPSEPNLTLGEKIGEIDQVFWLKFTEQKLVVDFKSTMSLSDIKGKPRGSDKVIRLSYAHYFNASLGIFDDFWGIYRHLWTHPNDASYQTCESPVSGLRMSFLVESLANGRVNLSQK